MCDERRVGKELEETNVAQSKELFQHFPGESE
jgi:hypothetical protein